MAPTRNPRTYYETEDDAIFAGTEYRWAHLCYIGIEKFNRADWEIDDPLFDPNYPIPDEHLFGHPIYGSDEVWSNKGKGKKERSALAHLFEGKEGGFHHHFLDIAENGVQHNNKTIVDKHTGVYRVDVTINEKNGPKIYKNRIFFPDSWSREQVTRSIKEAYRNARYLEGNVFHGTDSNGFPIAFSIDENFCIMSAYPHYPK